MERFCACRIGGIGSLRGSRYILFVKQICVLFVWRCCSVDEGSLAVCVRLSLNFIAWRFDSAKSFPAPFCPPLHAFSPESITECLTEHQRRTSRHLRYRTPVYSDHTDVFALDPSFLKTHRWNQLDLSLRAVHLPDSTTYVGYMAECHSIAVSRRGFTTQGAAFYSH